MRNQAKYIEQKAQHMMDELRSDYRAAKNTRFTRKLTGVSSLGSGADYHYASEMAYLRIMERARDYQRNDPVVGQGVRRLAANLVQEGFRLDVTTGDDLLDKALADKWEQWTNDADLCHSEGELSFVQQESLIPQTVTVDGDLFILPRKEGFLQFVEAHRCRTPRNTKRDVIHGVLLGRDARRQQYWFTREDLSPTRALTKVSDIQQYEARDESGYRQVFHLYHANRFSQRRGVSALSPVSEMVTMHDDLEFSQLVKAQVASAFALIHEYGENAEPFGEQKKGDQTTEKTSGRLTEKLSSGIEIFGDPGESIKAFSPNVPNPEFFEHAKLILSFIALNLDLPLQVFLLDPTQTNFSGWRGAIDQAQMRFRQLQRWLVNSFHSPVYRWKVRQWIETDSGIKKMAAQSGVRVAAHKWHPPSFPYIEPLKDASADLLQQRNALNSPRRIQAARNRNWDDVSTEIIEDNASAIEKAVMRADELNRQNPTAQISWRDLLSLPTPDGVTVSTSHDSDNNGSANGNATEQLFARGSLN
tara:strand:- start:317 stop:1909 length:1593 start_codon:yes stop_codon:yes gene_type:complete